MFVLNFKDYNLQTLNIYFRKLHLLDVVVACCLLCIGNSACYSLTPSFLANSVMTQRAKWDVSLT